MARTAATAMTDSADGSVTRSKRGRDQHDEHATLSPHLRQGVRRLFELGRERGYVTEDDIDEVFEEDPEPPDSAEIEMIHKALLDASIEVVESDAEVAEVEEDIETDDR